MGAKSRYLELQDCVVFFVFFFKLPQLFFGDFKYTMKTRQVHFSYFF